MIGPFQLGITLEVVRDLKSTERRVEIRPGHDGWFLHSRK
jgi:hypothetical protein